MRGGLRGMKNELQRSAQIVTGESGGQRRQEFSSIELHPDNCSDHVEKKEIASFGPAMPAQCTSLNLISVLEKLSGLRLVPKCKPTENANDECASSKNDVHFHVGVAERGQLNHAQHPEYEIGKEQHEYNERNRQRYDAQNLLHYAGFLSVSCGKGA